MEYVTLNNGIKMPKLGYGVYQTPPEDTCRCVREAIDEQGFLGIFTGGLKATAGGITAAIVAGLCVSLLFKAKDKS